MAITLGRLLKEARARANLSLRAVEKQTNGKISNGYLSLLESDAVKAPSPHYLHELARVYAIDYGRLMQATGYTLPASNQSRPLAFSNEEDLTPEERGAVETYIEFVLSRRPKRDSKP
jgi:transcriptional regulator with XRE-family HTH domain